VPDDTLSKTIVGVLDGYARAHGQEAGGVAPRISEGQPHHALRWSISGWAMRLGTILIVIGLTLDIIGARRARTVKRLRTALENYADAPLPA
jgi:hypothetical protein